MLSPRYLDGLSDEIAEIYSQLENDILTDMARRIARLGKITDATKWQAKMLSEAGGLKRNIPKILAKYDRTVANQVKKAFEDAMATNARNDNKIFSRATGRTVSAPNAQAMLSTIQKCHSDLSRLTLTTAATSQEQFVQQANRSFMDVMSGAFDYDTAMKNAADELADEGIRTVQYENGKPVRRSIESAVRMNIITSINQTAANQTLNNCEELGCDLVETSAHIGARPEHEDWQGEVFSLSGKNKNYRPFSVCGLGTPTGICGINCRHSYYPYFEEMDGHYTQDDLDEMSAEKVTYTDVNGEERELSRYEGEQKLRGIERKIRFYKKRALTEEAAGADNTASRQKLGEWQAKARDFTEQTGIRRDYAREYVGTKGEQPRGIAAVYNIRTAKTTEEAQQLAMEKLGIKNAEYGAMDLNVANMMNKEIESAQKTFATAMKNFGGVKIITSKSRSYAEYNKVTKTVYMKNVSDSESLQRMKEDAKQQFNLGFWSTNNKEHSARHEIGHHIFHELTDSNPELKAKIEKIYFEKVKEVLDNKLWKRDDLESMKKAKSYGISFYALSNIDDFGAECIAEFFGGNMRETARKVCEILLKEK